MAVNNIPGAFQHADMEEEVHMLLNSNHIKCDKDPNSINLPVIV